MLFALCIWYFEDSPFVMKPNMAAVMMPHTRCTYGSRNDLLVGVVAQNRDDFGASKIVVYASVHRCFERRILYFPIEFSSVLFRKTNPPNCDWLALPPIESGFNDLHSPCGEASTSSEALGFLPRYGLLTVSAVYGLA